MLLALGIQCMAFVIKKILLTVYDRFAIRQILDTL